MKAMIASGEYQTAERMGHKREAIPLPDLDGKSVLDVGCDHGAWCWIAAEAGATKVVGLDRNRIVKGKGHTNLIAQNAAIAAHDYKYRMCRFERVNLGKQWYEYGRFDVVLMFSVYHHIYECCGDHEPIWFWLWRHVSGDGVVLWENPVDCSDGVVQRDVSPSNQAGYNRDAMLRAASHYFEAEYIGPALHVETREVWRFKPKKAAVAGIEGVAKAGAGGASKAFLHADKRRIKEIWNILEYAPEPGSLNVQTSEPFNWERGYYRAQILDVIDRKAGLDSAWAPRWARFYPVRAKGIACHAFRFEGENYPQNFVEMIAACRLRDKMQDDEISIERWFA